MVGGGVEFPGSETNLTKFIKLSGFSSFLSFLDDIVPRVVFRHVWKIAQVEDLVIRALAEHVSCHGEKSFRRLPALGDKMPDTFLLAVTADCRRLFGAFTGRVAFLRANTASPREYFGVGAVRFVVSIGF